jgi:hypothetical protein
VFTAGEPYRVEPAERVGRISATQVIP